ncbi:hypothetical protein DB30_05673 [Enhygromyxa salina]|uniref:DUF4349 domain-containing protein n=1 Tax=Enhygromyxa salina TaxID=215803 RepID=A0A0C2CWC1_9BACT|nr:DUF4349 domain-containing protein [Enhygromyxa salina]KIG15341.1 hypothetical protein DB30_05673 [Enhygromyxa salina]
MRAPIPLLCLIFASTSACAAKHSAPNSPDYYDSYPGDAAMRADDGSLAGPAPTAGGAPSVEMAPASTGALPSSVFGAPAPTQITAAPDQAEPAIEPLDTVGADAVDQMLIFTGQLAIKVDFSVTAKTIDTAVGLAVSSGGYVAQMTDTTLTLRVPSKRFRKVMSQLEGLGDVLSRAVQALDVSEEYHDLQVQLDNLKATRGRIEKLLAQSKDLAQILTVEKELQRVTAEIDHIEGRIRLLSSQAAFSTISIAFSERPEQREVKIAADDGASTPASPPRTLSTSADWISNVGVNSLMNFGN